jgi:hypothetical protein
MNQILAGIKRASLVLILALASRAQGPLRGPDPLIEAVNYLDQAESIEKDFPEKADQWYAKALGSARRGQNDLSADPRRAAILIDRSTQGSSAIKKRLTALDQAYREIKDLRAHRKIMSALQRLAAADPPKSQPRFLQEQNRLAALLSQVGGLKEEAAATAEYRIEDRIHLYRKALRINSEDPTALANLRQLEVGQ